MTNKTFDINLPLHATLISAGGLMLAFGVWTASVGVGRITGDRSVAINQTAAVASLDRQQQLTRKGIETEADKAKAASENNVNRYNSLTLDGYVCDPANPPQLDWNRYVQDGKVKVTDRNQLVIGDLMPSGNFYFSPNNCRS